MKVREDGPQPKIFDALRRKWLVLTPEEWVRQHFIQFLIQGMSYPPALIAIEKEIRLGEMRKRFDIVVFDREHQPWMIVECKEMGVKPGEKTVDQIVAYQMALPSKHLIITNGSYTYAFEKVEGRFLERHRLPEFPSP